MPQEISMIPWTELLSGGYGKIPKSVLHDSALSLESKAIYAYFCALAGSSLQTYPYRDTVLRELGLSKNTYYKYYKPLVALGYLAVEKPVDKSAANVYTLLVSPSSKAAGGYGILPKQVMRDSSLSVKAKGLYAYLCSYCGDKAMAFPRKSDILFHLNISEPTYYKLYHQLWERGYVAAVQRKERGRFGVNTYYIKEEAPAQTQDFFKQNTICDTTTRDTKNKDTTKQDAIINTNLAKNKKINNSLSKAVQLVLAEKETATDQTETSQEKMVFSLLQQKYHCDTEQSMVLAQRFLQHFTDRCKGKNIGNRAAYLQKALHNWLAETGGQVLIGGQAPRVTAVGKKPIPFPIRSQPSYDLEQLERLLNERAIL